MGRPRADERDELLVEDEEVLEVDLLAARRGSYGTAWFDGVDEVARLQELRAQFISRGSGVRLLLHVAALIR